MKDTLLKPATNFERQLRVSWELEKALEERLVKAMRNYPRVSVTRIQDSILIEAESYQDKVAFLKAVGIEDERYSS